MSDIKFNCQSCGTELEAPEEMAGEVVECPSCSQNISIPQPVVAEVNASGINKSADACPNCSAAMEPDAVMCLQCGYHKGLGKVINTDLS